MADTCGLFLIFHFWDSICIFSDPEVTGHALNTII